MTSAAHDLAQVAREWHEAVILYPVYSALSREFVFDVAPCTVLETVTDVPDHDTVEEAREWLALMDGRTQVHQLRQFLQTTSLADEERVRALLSRHLRKPIKTNSDRDKIDFLLVQFFSLTAPSQLSDADVSLDFVAQTLEPVLGPVEPAPSSRPVLRNFSPASRIGTRPGSSGVIIAATRSQLEGIVRDSQSDVIQIGYGGQSGFRPKLRHDCGPADVLDARHYTTQCGLVKGDSGSPLLLHEDGKYRIIGINYAWVDLDFINHVFLVVGSASFDPTLKDLIAGKMQATPVKEWIKAPQDKGQQSNSMGQPFRQQ